MQYREDVKASIQLWQGSLAVGMNQAVNRPVHARLDCAEIILLIFIVFLLSAIISVQLKIAAALKIILNFQKQ